MKNYSVKNKNYCVNKLIYCVNKINYCVNNFGFDIQTLRGAQLASPQGTLNFVNPYPDLCNLQGNAQETELFYYHPDHLGSTGMVTDNSSIISQGFLYAPFGEIIAEYGWQSPNVPKYAFNAKELDEENNMYYYSARYYAPPTFISRDPMFEKYPSISPYTYCANNPVMFVDPDGRKVRITGEDAESATKEIDKSTSLKITKDENGFLKAKGLALNKSDRQLKKVINSKKIMVNLETTRSKTYDSKDGLKGEPLAPAAFEGSELNVILPDFISPVKVLATQIVNMSCANIIANIIGESVGETLKHEINEAYWGARLHPGGDYKSAFNDAHNKASKYDRIKDPGISVYTSSIFGNTVEDMLKAYKNGKTYNIYPVPKRIR